MAGVPRRQQIPGEQITSRRPAPSPRSLDHQYSAPPALTLGCSCSDLTGPASPSSPDRPSFTKRGKGMCSRSENVSRDSVQTDGTVWSPSLVPGLPPEDALLAGAVFRCTRQRTVPLHASSEGAQTHMDVLRPYKGMKQRGWGHEAGVGAALLCQIQEETCMPHEWTWTWV